MPSLAVEHGCVGDAFEEMNAVNNGREQVADVGAELYLRVRRVDLMVEAIKALPLLG